MEALWVGQHAHLRHLLQVHPGWFVFVVSAYCSPHSLICNKMDTIVLL